MPSPTLNDTAPPDTQSSDVPPAEFVTGETSHEELTSKKRRRRHRRHHHTGKPPTPKTFMEKLKKRWQDAKDVRSEMFEDAREGRRDKWGRKTVAWDKHWHEIVEKDALERVKRREERKLRKENKKKDEGPVSAVEDEVAANIELDETLTGDGSEVHSVAERNISSSAEDLATTREEETANEPDGALEKIQTEPQTAPPKYQAKAPSNDGHADNNGQEGSPAVTGSSNGVVHGSGRQPHSTAWTKIGGAKSPTRESDDDERSGDSSSDASSTKATVTSKSPAAREAVIRGGSGGDDDGPLIYQTHEDFDDEYDKDNNGEVDFVSAMSHLQEPSLRSSQMKQEQQAPSVSYEGHYTPHVRSPQPYFIPKPPILDFVPRPEIPFQTGERPSRPYRIPNPRSYDYTPAHHVTPRAWGRFPQPYSRWQNPPTHAGSDTSSKKPDPGVAGAHYSRYAKQENTRQQHHQHPRHSGLAPLAESDNETESAYEERQRKRRAKRKREEAKEKREKEGREREWQQERERKRAEEQWREKKSENSRRSKPRRHPRRRRDPSSSSASSNGESEDLGTEQVQDTDQPPLNHLYTLLSISRSASHEAVIKAARAARILVHPDRLGPNRSETQKHRDAQRAAEVGHAADVLGDPEQREEYDEEQSNRKRQ